MKICLHYGKKQWFVIILLGTDDDIVTTATITILFRLEKEDIVYVIFHTEKNHGDSKLVSNNFKAIHFIGYKISD